MCNEWVVGFGFMWSAVRSAAPCARWCGKNGFACGIVRRYLGEGGECRRNRHIRYFYLDFKIENRECYHAKSTSGRSVKSRSRVGSLISIFTTEMGRFMRMNRVVYRGKSGCIELTIVVYRFQSGCFVGPITVFFYRAQSDFLSVIGLIRTAYRLSGFLYRVSGPIGPRIGCRGDSGCLSVTGLSRAD